MREQATIVDCHFRTRKAYAEPVSSYFGGYYVRVTYRDTAEVCDYPETDFAEAAACSDGSTTYYLRTPFRR